MFSRALKELVSPDEGPGSASAVGLASPLEATFCCVDSRAMFESDLRVVVDRDDIYHPTGF